MLRILKPLRFITNNPSLKVLVNCLMESVPGLLNILLVITMVWYYFNIKVNVCYIFYNLNVRKFRILF